MPDTAKLTNVTGFGERCYLVREGKTFVKKVLHCSCSVTQTLFGSRQIQTPHFTTFSSCIEDSRHPCYILRNCSTFCTFLQRVRDAILACYMPWPYMSVHPSVYPYVTGRRCIKATQHIITQTTPRDSPGTAMFRI